MSGQTISAQATLPQLVSIPKTEVHTLHSPQVGADFQIWISEPIPGARPFPPGPRAVLYVLDANLFFGTAVEMSRIMAQLYGELPPLLVVGIAYDTDDPAVQSDLRTRDFTPTGDAQMSAMMEAMAGGRELVLPPEQRMGGAPAFLEFLRADVVPFVDDRFETIKGQSTLFGSSLGGLFALYSALADLPLFDAYIVTSPAIWWDSDMLFELEEKRAATATDLAARLVLVVGADEERSDVPMLARFRMVSNVQTIAERLKSRQYPSLCVTTLVPVGDSHTTVVPTALTRGLKTIYPPVPPILPSHNRVSPQKDRV